jgi:hypothetical protein
VKNWSHRCLQMRSKTQAPFRNCPTISVTSITARTLAPSWKTREHREIQTSKCCIWSR